MSQDRTRTILARFLLILGAAGLWATGADHLYEYSANGFSTVPTIGTLFLLNFIAATLVGAGLLLPLEGISKRFGARLRAMLALGGIGIATTSLLGLWISETSSLFGFTDYGFRPTIVAAIVAESVTLLALSAYLGLSGIRLFHTLPRVQTH
jgi:hypothetical protein